MVAARTPVSLRLIALLWSYVRATRDQYDARMARPDNCTFTVGKDKQLMDMLRGVADHVPNARARGVYMRHFRSLP